MDAGQLDNLRLPTLAGLCTYKDAARQGYSVEDSVQRFVRYAWLEKRLMDIGLYWLNPTPEWEVKEALSLHLYLAAQHVELIRTRVTEMRNPPPRMDVSPSEPLTTFLDELLSAQDTLEKVVGLYGVLHPALLAAYKKHYEQANPLVDYPTRRMLRIMIVDQEEIIRWGDVAVAAYTSDPTLQARVQQWIDHLNAYLRAAGGIMGTDEIPQAPLPARHAVHEYQPDFFPKRDARFTHQWTFVFPPHEVARTDDVPVEEKTLALMCKRTLEMDVPEAMARMIAEAKNQPWQYYLDMTRQLWDEARHAMMGTVYFEKHGIDWKRAFPVHPAFAIRLNMYMTPLEAHAVLYTIEQSLMPAKTGKRYEWETVAEAHDDLATLFQDYDWADEVLHAQIGRRWAIQALGMKQDEVLELGRRKAIESELALAQYADRGKQVNWWPEFVRNVLGTESKMPDQSGSVTDPVYSRGTESGSG